MSVSSIVDKIPEAANKSAMRRFELAGCSFGRCKIVLVDRSFEKCSFAKCKIAPAGRNKIDNCPERKIEKSGQFE